MSTILDNSTNEKRVVSMQTSLPPCINEETSMQAVWRYTGGRGVCFLKAVVLTGVTAYQTINTLVTGILSPFAMFARWSFNSDAFNNWTFEAAAREVNVLGSMACRIASSTVGVILAPDKKDSGLLEFVEGISHVVRGAVHSLDCSLENLFYKSLIGSAARLKAASQINIFSDYKGKQPTKDPIKLLEMHQKHVTIRHMDTRSRAEELGLLEIKKFNCSRDFSKPHAKETLALLDRLLVEDVLNDLRTHFSYQELKFLSRNKMPRVKNISTKLYLSKQSLQTIITSFTDVEKRQFNQLVLTHQARETTRASPLEEDNDSDPMSNINNTEFVPCFDIPIPAEEKFREAINLKNRINTLEKCVVLTHSINAGFLEKLKALTEVEKDSPTLMSSFSEDQRNLLSVLNMCIENTKNLKPQIRSVGIPVFPENASNETSKTSSGSSSPSSSPRKSEEI